MLKWVTRVLWVLVFLALTGGMIATVMAGSGRLAGWDAGMAWGTWLVMSFAWVTTARSVRRWRYAAGEWERVAHRYHTRYTDHMTTAHPDDDHRRLPKFFPSCTIRLDDNHHTERDTP